MNLLKIDRMSDDGAVKTVKDICAGIICFAEKNPESAKELIVQLTEGTLDPLAEDDFFGTEGWEHAFRMD